MVDMRTESGVAFFLNFLFEKVLKRPKQNPRPPAA
jgi:hypothetical protein